jgi:divalent metal cation (Fe/Co/Zn/Cd) transporter
VADSTLPNVVQDVFASASGVIGGVTLIIYNLPQITPLIAVVAGGYFLIQVAKKLFRLY